jgi:hypothetical protein
MFFCTGQRIMRTFAIDCNTAPHKRLLFRFLSNFVALMPFGVRILLCGPWHCKRLQKCVENAKLAPYENDAQRTARGKRLLAHARLGISPASVPAV